eukprot:UN16158
MKPKQSAPRVLQAVEHDAIDFQSADKFGALISILSFDSSAYTLRL